MIPGHIKLWRKIKDSFIWEDKPFSAGQAWIDLIIDANYKSKDVLFRQRVERCERGQFITSILKLSNRWGWDRKKVRRWLELFKKEDMIRYDIRDKRFILITICNYEQYQKIKECEGQDRDNKRTTEGTTNSPTKGTTKGTTENSSHVNTGNAFDESSDSSGTTNGTTNGTTERPVDDPKRDITKEVKKGRKKKKKKEIKDFDLNFEEWKIYAQESLNNLLLDVDWMEKMKDYHRTLDIEKTIKNSFESFFLTKDGWLHKEGNKECNWKNSMNYQFSSKGFNRVFKYHYGTKPETKSLPNPNKTREKYKEFINSKIPFGEKEYQEYKDEYFKEVPEHDESMNQTVLKSFMAQRYRDKMIKILYLPTFEEWSTQND